MNEGGYDAALNVGAAVFLVAGCQSAITTTTSYDAVFRSGVRSNSASRPPATRCRLSLSASRSTSLSQRWSDARSWARSITGPIASPDDPLFAQLVGHVTHLMIPSRDDPKLSQRWALVF